jgi:hypothetical protein
MLLDPAISLAVGSQFCWRYSCAKDMFPSKGNAAYLNAIQASPEVEPSDFGPTGGPELLRIN